ncbi:hypothetical conserved protein [Candidatus Nitrosoglobus terrae]|uniref:Hypothetical conserved protein n=1 Tax=Candidatus Nitrosoglobus terrae TaxID=1630141 RepID=A0A1Q2SL91_9GAMM|nr:DUF4124 domain-containing protein [Candidatus Nitrosoglobus terrae]BAW79915.1 hypothetical conserved protein [Candidatus Nitrosoglobus terrae]
MPIIFLLLSLISLVTTGDIYKYTHPDGTVEYSDQPKRGAIETELRLPRVYAPLQPKDKDKAAHEETPPLPPQAVPSYRVSIVTPHNEVTIRENRGNVEVVLQVQPPPEADSGYTLQLLLDGRAVSKPQNRLRYPLTDIDRGVHTLQAGLFDPSRILVAKSDLITFYMQRMSILFHNTGTNNPGGVQMAPRAPQMPKMPGPPNSGGAVPP